MTFRSQEIRKPCKGFSPPKKESGIMQLFSSSAAVRKFDCSFIQQRQVCKKRLAKMACTISKPVQELLSWARCCILATLARQELAHRHYRIDCWPVLCQWVSFCRECVLSCVKVSSRLCTLSKSMTGCMTSTLQCHSCLKSCSHTDLPMVCLHTDKVVTTDCLNLWLSVVGVNMFRVHF